MASSPGLGYLKPLFKKHRGSFVAAVAFLGLEATCDVMQPTLMAQLINQGVMARDLAALVNWASLMLLFVAVGAMAAVCRNFLSARVAQGFGGELRTRAFSHVMGLSFHQLRRWDVATIQTRLTFDVAQVQNLVNGLMRLYLKAPLLGLGALTLMFVMDPGLAVWALPVVGIVVVLFRRQLRRTLPLFQRSQQLLDEVSARARDFLHGVRVVKAFGRQEKARSEFAAANEELSRVSAETQTIQASFSPMVSWAVGGAVVAILAVGGWGATADPPVIGRLMAFVQYFTQMLFALIIVTSLVGIVSRARTSALRIGELLSDSPEVVPNATTTVEPVLQWRHVGLGGGADPILDDISFSLPAGKQLGILGSTGSGKTSLLQVLMGLLPPTRGEILLPPWKMALVPQKALLFRGTVRENLVWGARESSDDQLREALQIADALEFVEALPEGWQTRLGPGGVTLSGGQRQRLTLARALASRPDLLVLDEAFSALDFETQRRIEQRMRSAFPELTQVIVAQKARSVQSCHTILILNEGRCEALGDHRALAKSSEVYRQICASQGWELEQ